MTMHKALHPKDDVNRLYVKKRIPDEKTLTRLKKGNRKRETESLLIAVQNNAIRVIISKQE